MTEISTPLEVEEYLFTLRVGSKEYTIDTKWLLNLKVGLTDNLSDIELEESLQKIAGYLHVFSSAYDEVSRAKATTQLEYDIWYASEYAKSEEDLSTDYAEEVASGLRSKTNSSPSRTQIENHLINRLQEEYKTKNLEVNTLTSNAEYLLREMKLIESRGTHLQTLIKSRQAIRNIE